MWIEGDNPVLAADAGARKRSFNDCGPSELFCACRYIERMQALLVNQAAYDALIAGQDPRRIAQDWMEELEKFEKIREKYLIYK